MRRARRPALSAEGIAATATFAVLLPAGVLSVRLRDLDPLTSEGAAAPVAYALAALLVVAGLCLVVRRPWCTGVAAGVLAAWASVAVACSLVGTPYGSGAMLGDAGRMSALASYFATTWASHDAADPALPPEYPPLYPMLVGRAAALVDRPAWTLLATAQAALVGASVLAAFLLWRRLVPGGVALALSVTTWAGLSEPSKGNEILALSVFLPLVLGAFAVPDGRRPLHPVLSGVLFGLMVPLFPNFLILGLLGVGGVIVLGWRGAPNRWAYARRAGVTVGLAAALSSWYLGPLLLAYASGQPEVVADLYRSMALGQGQFALFDSSSHAVLVLQAVGALGVVLWWRAAWWAPPLGVLVVGILMAKTLMLSRFTGGGHSFLLLYTPYLLQSALSAAGVLALHEAARAWGGRVVEALGTPRPLARVIAVCAVVAVLASTTYSNAWAVRPSGVDDHRRAVRSGQLSLTALSHTDLRPDGTAPEYPWPVLTPGFPATAAYRALSGTQPPGSAAPVVLSDDQRFFSYRWFPNYLPSKRESSSALTRWDSREAEVRRLSGITGSTGLADALRHTAFGPLDALVLRRKAKRYSFRDITFSAAALFGGSFVIRPLADHYTLFVARRAS